MIENVIIFDSETSTLEPATGHLVEVGCILYSITHACPIVSYATLVQAHDNAAEEINGIPAAALTLGALPALAWASVIKVASRASAMLIHNESFDVQWMPETLAKSIPIICTMNDLAWPKGKPGESIVKLALAHGLGVSHAHRALADCDLISRLLTRVAETTDMQAFLARGLRPKALFEALVSYDDRRKAADVGFKWNADTKKWTRKMARDDVASLPFPTREVQA